MISSDDLLRTWINDNLCYLTINCDTGQHSQFLRCFGFKTDDEAVYSFYLLKWFVRVQTIITDNAKCHATHCSKHWLDFRYWSYVNLAYIQIPSKCWQYVFDNKWPRQKPKEGFLILMNNNDLGVSLVFIRRALVRVQHSLIEGQHQYSTHWQTTYFC